MSISIQQAAKIMRRSGRCVYSYIEAGRLTTTRVGRRTLLNEEEVRQFVPNPAGRKRVHFPRWRASREENEQSITIIFVPVCQGQQQQLRAKLQEIHTRNLHLFPGTVARYIMHCTHDPQSVQIVLVWRKTILPPDEDRKTALNALRMDCADLFEWECAITVEHTVMLRA